MAIGYAMAARKNSYPNDLAVFSIIVKFCATLFLFIYFIFIKQTWVILASGIADLMMGAIIFWAYSKKEN